VDVEIDDQLGAAVDAAQVHEVPVVVPGTPGATSCVLSMSAVKMVAAPAGDVPTTSRPRARSKLRDNFDGKPDCGSHEPSHPDRDRDNDKSSQHVSLRGNLSDTI
jgi:hypothetical protein